VNDRPGILVEVVLLAAWLGAAVFFSAVVAQAAFAVLPTRTLAGALVGRVLPVLFFAGIALGAIILVIEGLWGAGWLSGRGVAGILVVVACSVAQFWIGARIDRVRDAIGGPIDALAASDPRRQAFGRLHAFSVGWLGIAIVAALVALVLAARAAQTRTS
jgi:uncharacterized protein DUF4149